MRLVRELILGLVLVASAVRAQEASVWGANVGTDPCMAEDRFERAMVDDPSLRDRRALYEAMMAEAARKGLLKPNASMSGPGYVIPVAVHIVHQNGPENISDAQVQSQIWALNRDFANTPLNPSPAVNTGIQFCLASQLPVGSSVVWSTTPGITRTVSPQTVHTYGVPASEVALKAIDYLPSNQYLNIWVVQTIQGGGGGVAGYATFPGTVPAALDGIVIRYTCFGSDNTPYGVSWPTLLPSNNLGKIMSHEVGHWLDLLHTFHGGCTAPGDQVTDTPFEQTARTGCPTTGLTSCSLVNDPIENFMDYTNDVCRFAFTAGQTTRMQNAIAYFRSTLVSAQNLIDVGCPSGLNALIQASRTQICAPDAVVFTTPAAGTGYTYAWSFPGGTPSSATTQTATVNYPTAGVYPVTLTVTDGGSNSSTNTLKVYARACTPISGACANWVQTSNAGFSWATGTPVAVSGRSTVGAEPSSAISDNSGTLLFYTDGTRALTASNVVMPNGSGLLAGISSHNGALILKRPGSTSQYFLFTIRQWEDGPTANPMNYSVVDMSLNAGQGDIVSGQKNLLVALPGSPNELVEGMAAIPHCNGVDWWLVTNGSNSGSGKLYVTLVTAAGPASTTAYNIGIAVPSTGLGSVVPSRDGTRIGVCSATAGIYPNIGQIAVYAFNNSTGVPTTILAPTSTYDGYSDIAFSPNNKIVYYNTLDNLPNIAYLKQLDLVTLQMRTLITGPWTALRLGPDGLLYISQGAGNRLHVVNNPDQFNTSNLNECGLNLNAIPLPTGSASGPFGSLPNMPLQCSTVQPADFTYTVTNCLTVNFTSLNCSGPYSWTFGDLTSGSGASVSHTYAVAGTYTVTLTVPGAVPSTKTVTITLGAPALTIAGPTTVCDGTPRNYSVNGPPGYTYTWTVTGGTPATGTGNNIDVVWSAPGGSVLLTAVDPSTGCSVKIALNVSWCPTCVKPPGNMTAWYPLDEPTGGTAFEQVLGANGSDVNGPPHIPGKVRRARTFNGVNQWVQAVNAANLNFGTGDLSIDAWVRSSVTTGIQPIVSKTFPDFELGYMMYLKQGRLAVRFANGSPLMGTEYWANTGPLVADGSWHHVTATLQHGGTSPATKLYVDGALVFTGAPFVGNITNSEPFTIGARYNVFMGVPDQYFTGAIDEVELFQRALTPSEVASLFAADTLGKCKEFAWVPTTASFCRDLAYVDLQMRICNYTATAQTYTVAFAGLPTGGSCTWAAPTNFQLLVPNSIVVAPGGCLNVPYRVYKPAGMPLLATTCYQVTVTNTATAQTYVNNASITASKRWCNIIVVGPVGTGSSGGTAKIVMRPTNLGDDAITAGYLWRIVARDSSDVEAVRGVALNGGTPGEPFAGVASFEPGASQDLELVAEFTEPQPFRVFDVELLMDDGTGVFETIAVGGLEYGSTNAVVEVEPPAPVALPERLELAVTPNPVRGRATIHYALPTAGTVRLGLYDVAGREVVGLPAFEANAGRASLGLDLAALPRGVYFVRLDVNGRSAGRRFLRVE